MEIEKQIEKINMVCRGFDSFFKPVLDKLNASKEDLERYYIYSEILNCYIEKKSTIPVFKLDNKGKLIDCFTHFKDVDFNSLNAYVTYINKEGYSNTNVLYNEELFKELGIVENFIKGNFQDKDYVEKNKDYPKFNEFKNMFSGKNLTISQEIKIGKKSPSYILTEGKKYTFGVEIEMADGFIPIHAIKRNMLNIFCVKDGSITNSKGEKYGPEVVTGVLTGDAGFNQLRLIANECSKRGCLNNTCGMHTHIGGMSFSKAFVLAAYKLGYKLQNEIFDMLPKSRRGNPYCFMLNDLNVNFNNITNVEDFNFRVDNYYATLFKILCSQNQDRKANKLTNHPQGAKAGYNHSNIRYAWLNFLPAMFNTKGDKFKPVYTLEFRNHSSTTNYTKIKSWVQICMAFCYVADNYYREILEDNFEFTLDNVIKKSFKKTNQSLIDYIQKRKYLFIDDINSKEEKNDLANNELVFDEDKRIIKILET
jgi:hypothetical protein